jgi:hypothetical protein
MAPIPRIHEEVHIDVIESSTSIRPDSFPPQILSFFWEGIKSTSKKVLDDFSYVKA